MINLNKVEIKSQVNKRKRNFGLPNDTIWNGTLGAILDHEDHHEDIKGKWDAFGVYGKHGVAWTFIEAQLCLWESMEFKWITSKHVKMKKDN